MDQNNNSQKWLILFWSRGAPKKNLFWLRGFSKIGKIKSSILFWLSHEPELEVSGCGGLPVAGRLLKASLAQAGGEGGGKEGSQNYRLMGCLWQPAQVADSFFGRQGRGEGSVVVISL